MTAATSLQSHDQIEGLGLNLEGIYDSCNFPRLCDHIFDFLSQLLLSKVSEGKPDFLNNFIIRLTTMVKKKVAKGCKTRHDSRNKRLGLAKKILVPIVVIS